MRVHRFTQIHPPGSYRHHAGRCSTCNQQLVHSNHVKVSRGFESNVNDHIGHRFVSVREAGSYIISVRCDDCNMSIGALRLLTDASVDPWEPTTTIAQVFGT